MARGGVRLFRFDGWDRHHHGLSASAAADTLLTHPIIKEFEGADWGIRKPRSNQLRLLSFAAGAMIAQSLAEGPI